MQIEIVDFNGADEIIQQNHLASWESVASVLTGMPLHIKASDQEGIQGNPIFDPVGTNEYIKARLQPPTWLANIPIPTEFAFLGKDIDFGSQGMLIEVQFSNYPFLLNNTVRSELFWQAEISLAHKPTEVAVIITKAHMFPASNSTLYYEQGKNQLTALARNSVFDVPIRLVGLFESRNAEVPIVFTEYSAARYSRTVVRREDRTCSISPGRTSRSRCTMSVIDET